MSPATAASTTACVRASDNFSGTRGGVTVRIAYFLPLSSSRNTLPQSMCHSGQGFTLRSALEDQETSTSPQRMYSRPLR